MSFHDQLQTSQDLEPVFFPITPNRQRRMIWTKKKPLPIITPFIKGERPDRHIRDLSQQITQRIQYRFRQPNNQPLQPRQPSSFSSNNIEQIESPIIQVPSNQVPSESNIRRQQENQSSSSDDQQQSNISSLSDSSGVQDFDPQDLFYNINEEEQENYGNYIERFILQNNIGCVADYKIPFKNVRIYDHFSNKNKYTKNLTELVKYQIISDINKRITQKSQQPFQRQIRVRLTQHYFYCNKLEQYRKVVIMHPVNEYNQYYIEEALIKGKRVGLISKIKPFKMQNLWNREGSTRLCCIQKREQSIKDEKIERIFVKGLEMLDILGQKEQNAEEYQNTRKNWTFKSIQDQQRQQRLASNQYYFIDLDSIISSIRQYTAVKQSSRLPLIRNILSSNSKAKSSNTLKRQKYRKRELQNGEIIVKIEQARNQTQLKAITQIFKIDQGIKLIQGPPGTGKTQCIVNFASLQQQFLSRNRSKKELQQGQTNNQDVCSKKLMICAQANAAINHIGRKMLQTGLIGRDKQPFILRLGHTQQYDKLLLSINLPHLCEIQLLGTKDKESEWSAKIRWQKLVLQEQINKMIIEEQQIDQIRKKKLQLFKKIKKLVEINRHLKKKHEQFKNIEQKYLDKSEIVLSTLNTSGKARFARYYHNKIKCLVIDEASQATEPSTLIPFHTMTKKVILVGDHMQLPPTVMSKNCKYTLYNRSFFERQFRKGNKPYFLDTQYRMVPMLRKFPSDTFYEGALKDGRIVKVPQSLQKLKSNSIFINIRYGSEQESKKSYINEEQADSVKLLIAKLIKIDNKLTIGVIAPYKAQVKRIQYLCIGMFKLFGDSKRKSIQQNIKISTVDAFQGQQMDVIIISCVRSNCNKKIGFVSDAKRMNVSITRAKYALIVLGNVSTLQADPLWNSYIAQHREKQSIIASENQQQTKSIVSDRLFL